MQANRLSLALGLVLSWSPMWIGMAGVAVVFTPLYVLAQGRYAPEQWLVQGQQQFEAGHWQTALQNLAEAERGFGIRGDRQNLALTRLLQGHVHQAMAQYAQALERYQKAEPVFAQQPEVLFEIRVNQANAHQAMGDLALALQQSEQAQVVAENLPDRQALAVVLANKGALFRALGDEQQALGAYQQARAIFETGGDRPGLAQVLMSLGNIQSELGDSRAALGLYDQAREMFEALGDRASWATVLLNQGKVYSSLGRHGQAIAAYDQAEPLLAAAGLAHRQGQLLLNRGFSQRSLGQNQLALQDYQRALVLVQGTGDRHSEGFVLSNLGELFESQAQADLAILFYKQSVKLREAIRAPLGELDRARGQGPERSLRRSLGQSPLGQSLGQSPVGQSLEQSYVRSVAETYRALATLLIGQGRLPEAQAVLEQLKLQELEDFTRDGAIGGRGIDLAQVEQAALSRILQAFQTVAQFGQQLSLCEQTHCANLGELRDQRDRLFTSMTGQIQGIEGELRQHFSSDLGAMDSRTLNAEARRIVNSAPGTALLYPLILKDKIQLLLALKTGQGVVFRPFEIPGVSSDRLFQTISAFRGQLSSAGPQGPTASIASVQATGQQLYDWLIEPMEAELQAAQIQHLVIAPDRSTRYIPFGAIYDGTQYLAERFALSTVAAASGTDTSERFPQAQANQPFLLAMGASVFPDFAALAAVPAEVDAIARTTQSTDQQGIYPGSEFLDRQFDYAALKNNLSDHRVLHIATHGVIQPGRPEDSYLVTGKQVNGKAERITTAQIDGLLNYGLSEIHLVVLSACETGVGDRNSDGIEIPGISYFFLKNEVKSVMASLWSVNDASTSLMMREFYQRLAEGMGKAEAIRLVQQNFIAGKLTAKHAPMRASVAVTGPVRGEGRTEDFRHPYYWAPFILVGNGI